MNSAIFRHRARTAKPAMQVPNRLANHDMPERRPLFSDGCYGDGNAKHTSNNSVAGLMIGRADLANLLRNTKPGFFDQAADHLGATRVILSGLAVDPLKQCARQPYRNGRIAPGAGASALLSCLASDHIFGLTVIVVASRS